MDLLTIVVILALIATVVTLLMGLISMGSGESMDREFGTPLMWIRVGLQAFAVILLLIAVWLH